MASVPLSTGRAKWESERQPNIGHCDEGECEQQVKMLHVHNSIRRIDRGFSTPRGANQQERQGIQLEGGG